ncbi:MAG: molybdopterin-dependent oxidoreductase, partial [Oscillospiraceae bacterium]|nr:molybdopterin-dependent oxidoreductase [Oscillospiraceae bacterium]
AVEKQCDLHLRIRPGTDGALALGLGRELIINDWVNHEYIQNNVYGYDAYRDYVMDFSPERVEKLTDVPAEQIRLAARMIHTYAPLAINQSSAAMVHHINGMQSHRAIMALSALMGSYDRPGGIIPIPLTYAHSMAGFSTLDHEFSLEPYPHNAPQPVGAERFPLWARVVGEMQCCDLARQITEGTPYPIKALWAHGMNMRMFNADRELEAALKTLDFFVDTDLFLTDTAKLADIVLPCCSSFERSEFKVFGGGFAQWTEPVISPLGESRPDDAILCELARRLSLDAPLLCAGPEACVRYMLRETPIDVDFLKANSQLPQKVEGLQSIPIGQHPFQTPTGRFELYSTVIAELPGLNPLPVWEDIADDATQVEYPFRLVSGARMPNTLHSRLHDVPWLRSLRPEPAADLNDEDADRLGICAGDSMTLTTSAGSLTVAARPSPRVKKGTVHMYHGYREADINAIVPAGFNDPYSGFPGFRSVPCRIARCES